MEQNFKAMSGDTISTYKAIFLGQVRKAITSLHAVSLVRGAAVASQEGMWRDARQDVADILEGARIQMDKIADGDSPTWKLILKAAGWANKGMGFFLKGGKVATDFVGLGLEMLSDDAVSGPEEIVKEPGSYNDGIEALKGMLEALEGQILFEETIINKNIAKNINAVYSDRSSYDLTQPPIYDTGGVIIIDEDRVCEITQKYMPLVADELTTTAATNPECSTYGIVSRRDGLGIDRSGPSSNLWDLNWLIYELIKELSWEVTNGAKNLDLAVADLLHQDETSSAELAAMGETVSRGSGYDPWGEQRP